MRTLAIITGKCIISARKLAEGMNTRTNGEWQAQVYDVRKDVVPQISTHLFMYGCSESVDATQSHINTSKAVKRCVDKVATFHHLNAEHIPVPKFTQNKGIAERSNWERIVVRSKVDGRKAEDLDFYFQGDVLPAAPLYTEYFDHKYEYRITVFMGKVVGRYFKHVKPLNENSTEWHFMVQPKKGFELMDKACLKAAKALGIDYVGFDVVAKTKKDFVILEANSGPILTDEAEEAIINYYLNMEE